MGHFSIVQWVGTLTYQLNMGTFYRQVHQVFHISILKLFCIGDDRYPHPTAVHVKDCQEWEASGILPHKGSGGRRKYLVAYSGYNKSEACWLPEIVFYSALGILNDYKVCHGLT